MFNRREFLTTAGAFALGGCKFGEVARIANPHPDFIWSDLVHFGHHMWGDVDTGKKPERKGIMTHVLTDEEFEAVTTREHLAKDRIHFDEAFWRELAVKLRKDGCNQILIDVGEFFRYPSHPELALKGSWEPDRLKAEVERLKGMGFEVIPKLNFSTCHDAWLGPYMRMISTPKYYEVCADVIRDTMEVFGDVRFVHLGFDEEDMPAYHKSNSLLVIRQGDLWWHDLNWFVREVEKYGARAWIWSDYIRRHPVEEFVRKMPKTVVQSPWTYRTEKPSFDDPLIKIFLTLAENGYDVIPCGSNCYGLVDNFPAMAAFCHKNLPADHFKGMLIAPWIKTIAPYRRLHWQASDLVAEAIRRSGRA